MKINVQNKLSGLQVLSFFEEEKKKDLKYGEIYAVNEDLLYIGLGKKKDLSLEKLRRLLGKASKKVVSLKKEAFSTDIVEKFNSLDRFDVELLGRAAAEGLVLVNYGFVKYLSKDKRDKKKFVSLVTLLWKGASAAFDKGLKQGQIIAESTNFARDLVNEPANVVNSVVMEKMARKVASLSGKVSVKVLNEAQMERLGMGALLGVNKGSKNPPKLIFIEYKGGSGKPIALVGKGITFDSGGYNLKPTRYIETMKTDMGGAAAVLGAVRTAALLNVKKNIVGVMAVCENMVDAAAQRPGDIVKAYNGKTIEIGNTDAEGRLVLADALSYTEKTYKPAAMIDIATLTGAVVMSLGYYAAGLITKDDDLAVKLYSAGLSSGDRVWQLPFFEDYQDWMDGNISDLTNMSFKAKGWEAGTITAAVFLSKFVEKTKWAHLDIAGTSRLGVGMDYLDAGVSGSGVRVLSYYLLGE